MIAEAYIDTYQLHGSPPQNYTCALRAFDGLGTPDQRANRPDRARRHGVIELTTYYGARVFEIDGYLSGSDTTDMWTKVDNLKQHFAMTGIQHVLKWRRQGLPYRERCEVVVGGPLDLPLRVVGPIVTWHATLVAADPRMYSDTLNTQTFAAAATLTNAGNFNTPPVITFNGPGTNPGLRNDELAAENEIHIKYTMGSGDAVVVDVAERTVTLNGADRPDLLDLATSDFWSLGYGDTHVTKLGGAASIQVDWRDARI